MLKFNKHNVTNGTHKARVSYRAFRMASTGELCVTLYAKDYTNDLHRIFSSEYENHSDSMTDYFEGGRVRIKADHPLYAAALARASALAI